MSSAVSRLEVKTTSASGRAAAASSAESGTSSRMPSGSRMLALHVVVPAHGADRLRDDDERTVREVHGDPPASLGGDGRGDDVDCRQSTTTRPDDPAPAYHGGAPWRQPPANRAPGRIGTRERTALPGRRNAGRRAPTDDGDGRRGRPRLGGADGGRGHVPRRRRRARGGQGGVPALLLHQPAVRLDMFPSLAQMEREIIDHDRRPVPWPGGGRNHLGRVESILMGVKIARDRARELHPEITAPEMVVPLSAHPAFWKAAHYFGLTMVRAPLRDDLHAGRDAYKRLITAEHGADGRLGAGPDPGHGRPHRGAGAHRRSSGTSASTSTPASAATSCRSWSSWATRSRVRLPGAGRDHDPRGPAQVRLHREGRLARSCRATRTSSATRSSASGRPSGLPTGTSRPR